MRSHYSRLLRLEGRGWAMRWGPRSIKVPRIYFLFEYKNSNPRRVRLSQLQMYSFKISVPYRSLHFRTNSPLSRNIYQHNLISIFYRKNVIRFNAHILQYIAICLLILATVLSPLVHILYTSVSIALVSLFIGFIV